MFVPFSACWVNPLVLSYDAAAIRHHACAYRHPTLTLTPTLFLTVTLALALALTHRLLFPYPPDPLSTRLPCIGPIIRLGPITRRGNDTPP